MTNTREEPQKPIRLVALDAWRQYEASGLHLTAEEADAWLAKLEAGGDSNAPDCHI